MNDWRDDGMAAHQLQLEQQERAYAAMRGWPHPPLRSDEDKHMKIGDMIDSKYLKQSDVPEPVTVSIHSLKKVNVARDDEEADYRWTAKFSELPKPMVLNVTNLKRLAKALGDDTDGWLGKPIELYTDPDIEFGGNIVGGLRLRGIRRAAVKTTRNVDDVNRELASADDDVPF